VGWQARMDEQAGLQEHQRTASVPPEPPPPTPPTSDLGVGQEGWGCHIEAAASSRGSKGKLKRVELV